MKMAKTTLKELKKELTTTELEELKKAETKPIQFDEDCPELSLEQLLEFKRVNRANRTKPSVSLRISPDTLQKAKQYGKGYTGLLSRLLDLAINDEELVRKCI